MLFLARPEESDRLVEDKRRPAYLLLAVASFLSIRNVLIGHQMSHADEFASACSFWWPRVS
jgi:hypothetical protein